MKLLEKILLATDFGKSTENLVNNAIGLAKTFNSKIILVHVLPNLKNEKTGIFLKEAILKKLEIINEKINNAGIITDKPILEYGNHFDKIIQTADGINANTILIGAGEKLNNDRCQLGTTAEKIIRQSDKPVWVIKNENTLKVRNILCPVDFSQESKRALNSAITIAKKFKAKLVVLSVYEVHNFEPPNYKCDWDEDNEFVLSEHIKEFDLFLKDLNLTGLSWEKHTQKGDPSIEILKTLKINNSDLLIMGTTGKSGLIRVLMGSVTGKVIREVPCSFITLKSEEVISHELETRVHNLEKHFNKAKQLFRDGFYAKSIIEFKICLSINDMHIPALNGIAKAYKELGDTNNSRKYKNMSKEIVAKIWDWDMEKEMCE